MLVFIRMHSRIATVGFVFSAPKSMLFFPRGNHSNDTALFSMLLPCRGINGFEKKRWANLFLLFLSFIFFYLKFVLATSAKRADVPWKMASKNEGTMEE